MTTMRAACLSLLIMPVAAVRAAPPPRYALREAMVLSWAVELRSDGPEGHGALLEERIVRATCLRAHGDRWLVLIDAGRVGLDAPGPARGLLMWLDRRGRRTIEPETLPALPALRELLELWPVFPPAMDRQEVWQAPPDELGRVWHFRRSAGSRTIEFRVTDPTGIESCLGRIHTGTLTFDPELGVVRRVEALVRRRADGPRLRRRSRLEHVVVRDAGWLRARLSELEAWRRALRVEQRLSRGWATNPQRIGADTSRIRRLWQDLSAGLTAIDSPLRDLARSRIARLPGDIARWREIAKYNRRVFGRAAAGWSLPDATGQIVRSEIDPPRIRVECFWSIRSEPALRALVALQALKRRTPEVRFVAINLDPEPEVLRQTRPLAGMLTTLAGGPAMRPLAGATLPTLRIIDRIGRVRAVVHGWQPGDAAWFESLLRNLERDAD